MATHRCWLFAGDDHCYTVYALRYHITEWRLLRWRRDIRRRWSLLIIISPMEDYHALDDNIPVATMAMARHDAPIALEK